MLVVILNNVCLVTNKNYSILLEKGSAIELTNDMKFKFDNEVFSLVLSQFISYRVFKMLNSGANNI